MPKAQGDPGLGGSQGMRGAREDPFLVLRKNKLGGGGGGGWPSLGFGLMHVSYES